VMIKDKKKALRKMLVATRKAAAQELKASKEIKNGIDGLVDEAEKYLKGAEAYLKNLKKESRKPEEKGGMWVRVVEKVESKFSDQLRETENIVNGWYATVLGKEEYELKQITEEVKDLAERAQADIGLDYAWLDDVTYADWQRYHDLVRESENFTDHAQSVQNGTHPSPPINPVLSEITELQSEVQDIIMGFETRLRRIKRTGDRAFGLEVPEEEESEDDETSAPDGPEVSILPIPGDHTDQKPVVGEPVPVVGRGQREVEEALARAEGVESQQEGTAGELGKGAEGVASSIAQEVEVDAEIEMSTSTVGPPSVPPHVEL